VSSPSRSRGGAVDNSDAWPTGAVTKSHGQHRPMSVPDRVMTTLSCRDEVQDGVCGDRGPHGFRYRSVGLLAPPSPAKTSSIDDTPRNGGGRKEASHDSEDHGGRRVIEVGRQRVRGARRRIGMTGAAGVLYGPFRQAHGGDHPMRRADRAARRSAAGSFGQLVALGRRNGRRGHRTSRPRALMCALDLPGRPVREVRRGG